MITLTITMEPGQPPQVTGPIQDKMLCYALLEIARDAIKDYAPPLIQPANSMPVLPKNGMKLK